MKNLFRLAFYSLFLISNLVADFKVPAISHESAPSLSQVLHQALVVQDQVETNESCPSHQCCTHALGCCASHSYLCQIEIAVFKFPNVSLIYYPSSVSGPTSPYLELPVQPPRS